MTRPPRPKYPSDSKNYHEQRRPRFTQTIWLPEDLMETYASLKRCLGPNKYHADVVRFLFEAADGAIMSVIEAERSRLGPVTLRSDCAVVKKLKMTKIEVSWRLKLLMVVRRMFLIGKLQKKQGNFIYKNFGIPATVEPPVEMRSIA
ncbi:hypothetical protein R1sor_004494 [Riccia sorocarpa]|uniref:Histone H2A/H2B/H3 domain-containing protein n=1 Tax=Riccia sorocarpa TaxID=122646 RepID=A0ABD3HGV3_9MARC